jgi:tryptophanyl-tRNA synthetase
MIVMSGIQATGVPHLGNLLGTLLDWVRLQDTGPSYFMVADLHAITVAHDPATLRDNRLRTLAALLACGLDPERCVVFVQSDVPEHAQLTWQLSAITQLGELSRMTQLKDKATDRNGASAALFTYPVLQAADILLYGAHTVPIGEDQRQHLELTRVVARRFNERFGATFVVPRGLVGSAAPRVMDLQHPSAKMSKSGVGGSSSGTVFLDDPVDVVRRKIRRAVTGDGSAVDPEQLPLGVSNLLAVLAASTGKGLDQTTCEQAGRRYADLKDEVSDAVNGLLQPIQQRMCELMADPLAIEDVALRTAARAREVARPTLMRAMSAMGFGPYVRFHSRRSTSITRSFRPAARSRLFTTPLAKARIDELRETSSAESPWVSWRLWLFADDQGLVGLFRSVERLLVLGWWDVVEVAVQPAGVVPVDPAQGGQFEVVDGFPGLGVACWAADQLGLVVAVDGLGQSVVVGVADGPDRGNSADLGEPFAVADRGELGAGVGVTAQPLEAPAGEPGPA